MSDASDVVHSSSLYGLSSIIRGWLLLRVYLFYIVSIVLFDAMHA